jgi:starch-binding outer membrane protein, SusD/RagB family
MKNIYVIIIIALFSSLACNDDFLEKYPLDQITDQSYWKTSTDLEMYANQFYPSLSILATSATTTTTTLMFEAWDNNSDNQVYYNRPNIIWNLYTVPASGGGWGKSDWLGIRRCNYALDRIPGMPANPLNVIYEAEIRFFKANFYFQKVKLFGEVPWLEHSLDVDSPDLMKARDSRETITTNILSDLDFAIENLPETSSADRLTKYAAMALKSRVCLHEGTYRKYHGLGNYETVLREAVEVGDGIINSNKFSLYTTGKPDEDYYNMSWLYELKGNTEGIMVQRYLEAKNMHNITRQCGEAHTGYSKDFVNSYLCTDGLPIGLSPLYQGDAVFGDEFINRDSRLQQSVYKQDRIYRIFSDGTVYYEPVPKFDNNYCTTSYWILKYYSPYEKDRLQNQCVTDLFIYRYGRVLIEYAEAKAELGECTQEVLDKTVNLLRDRVGMMHLTVDVGFVDPNWPNWEVPVSPLINEIRRERRIELCYEGERWNDLQRWKAGKLLENPLTYLGARDPATGDYRVVYPGYTRTWDDKLYLYPIPSQEIALNPNLIQNPGWESK